MDQFAALTIKDKPTVAFIGDVHGCAAELEDLISMVRDIYGQDTTLISVGDLVDRGPKVHETVEICRQAKVKLVLGNHEEKLLRWKKGNPVRLSPEHQKSVDVLKEADWEYLAGAHKYIDLPELNMTSVHGGFFPKIPIGEQPLKSIIRLRMIEPGTMKMYKLGEESGKFWASQWDGPRHVVFGHEVFTGVKQFAHATGIDTGCVFGGKLTALIKHEGKQWNFRPGVDVLQVPARETYFGRVDYDKNEEA